jgi:hypothetical protein
MLEKIDKWLNEHFGFFEGIKWYEVLALGLAVGYLTRGFF